MGSSRIGFILSHPFATIRQRNICHAAYHIGLERGYLIPRQFKYEQFYFDSKEVPKKMETRLYIALSSKNPKKIIGYFNSNYIPASVKIVMLNLLIPPRAALVLRIGFNKNYKLAEQMHDVFRKVDRTHLAAIINSDNMDKFTASEIFRSILEPKSLSNQPPDAYDLDVAREIKQLLSPLKKKQLDGVIVKVPGDLPPTRFEEI